MKLCDYCGDNLSEAEENTKHPECLSFSRTIKEAVVSFKKEHALSDHVLTIAIHVNYLNPMSATRVKGMTRAALKKAKEEKREKREKKLKELLMKVTALRNSNSGHLIIQLVGLAAGDTYRGTFDEFVDLKLYELIEDGSLFGCVFRKECYMFREELFLTLYVEGTSSVTSFNFQTKISLDSSIVPPSPATMKRMVLGRVIQSDIFPSAITEFGNIHEDRGLQLKSISHLTDIEDKVWRVLKLREYISAFAHNENGGIYILGIGEEDTEYEGMDYASKKLDFHGMKADVCEKVKDRILQDVRELLVAYDYDGNEVEGLDPVEVNPTPLSQVEGVKDEYKNNYILQVSVRPFNGIVFYDRNGPLAYRVIKEGTSYATDKIPIKTWFDLMRNK